MLRNLLKFAVLIAGLGILLGYFIHEPLPPDVPERSSVQNICDVMGFVELVVSKFSSN